MSELKRGADIPVRHSELNGHSEDNGGLENPPSVERESGAEKVGGKWQKTTVGSVASGFLSGGTPTTSRADYWKGEIPWITSKWLGDKLELTTGEKFVSIKAIEKSATKIVPKNSIIFATRVGVGKVGINRIDLAINQDLAGILVDNEKYDIKFLAYQLGLDSIQQYVAMNKRGATIKGITRDCLEQIRLNIPPLPEQKKIAHILSTVQRAIEAQEQIIQTTTELKKALMHKLFTEGLRNEPQKETEIGLVPESWKLDRVDSAFEIQQGKQVSKKNREGDNQKPFLRTKNVFWNRLDLTDLDKMNFSEVEEKRLELHPGDLLTCEGGDIGRTALWNGEVQNCYFQNHLHRLRSKNGRVEPQFGVYWFWYAFNEAKLYFGRGNITTIPNLSRSKLAELPMAFPSYSEQKEIVALLDLLGNRSSTAEHKKIQLEDLFRTLLHELMTTKTQVHEFDFSFVASESETTERKAV